MSQAGQFSPLTMPLVKTGDPGYFQYFLYETLLDRIGKDSGAYLNGIMAYTKNGVNNKQAVPEIHKILKKHGQWLKLEK